MGDLSADRRAGYRATVARYLGWYRNRDDDVNPDERRTLTAVTVAADDLTALLDAADELDRIKAELSDPSRQSIMGGWLVIDTGQHNCGTGPGGHYGAHEPGCGLEQAIRLDDLPGWPEEPGQ